MRKINPVIVLLIFLLTFQNCKKEDEVELPNPEYGLITDIEGNSYKTIQIGNQIWMAENLKTTKYNDGMDIYFVPYEYLWKDLKNAGFTWYNFSDTYKDEYGGYYNWYAVNTKKLCPDGWHVPNDSEWEELTNYLIENGYNYDRSTDYNKVAKSLASTKEWKFISTEGSVGNTDYPAFRNKTGFSALPAGVLIGRSDPDIGGSIGFKNIGKFASWWSSTEHTICSYCAKGAGKSYIEFSRSSIQLNSSFKTHGRNVRCIKNK